MITSTSKLFGLTLNLYRVDSEGRASHKVFHPTSSYVREVCEEDLTNPRFVASLLAIAAMELNLQFKDALPLLTALHLNGVVDMNKVMKALHGKVAQHHSPLSFKDILQAIE